MKRKRIKNKNNKFKNKKKKKRKKKKRKINDFSNILKKTFTGFSKKYIDSNFNKQDKNSLINLTTTILKSEFSIEWDYSNSKNHLIPTVPKSLNYINFIHDLLCISNDIDCSKIIGIDIGVGASCIFPLLGYKLYKWNFYCTEIDLESIEICNNNIEINNLQNYIKVFYNSNSKLILQPNILPNNISESSFHFVMCNPPFFKNEVEGKRDNPNRICEATKNELITEGGEYNFIKKMIDDSMILKTKIKWYSSMIGKKETLKSIKKYLESKGILDYILGELIQGKLKRWVIAWNFMNLKIYLNNSFSKNISIQILNSSILSVNEVWENIEKYLNDNKYKYQYEKEKEKNGIVIMINFKENIRISILQSYQNFLSLKMESSLDFITKEFQNIYENLQNLFSKNIYI